MSELHCLRLTTPGKNYKLEGLPFGILKKPWKAMLPEVFKGIEFMDDADLQHRGILQLARVVHYSVSSAANNPQVSRGSVSGRDGEPSPKASHPPKNAG